jgi:hypothetical protein
MNKSLLLFTILFSSGLFAFAQSRIALVLPLNGDTIEMKNPMLSWSYMGLNQTPNERSFYRLILTEQNENQSAEAAVLLNQPLLLMDEIPGTQLFYPFDAPVLEEGKWYAWQIQKIQNQVLVDKSEAYRFFIPAPPVPAHQFYKIKQHHDGQSYLAIDGTLCFEFQEKYKDESLLFFLFDPNGNKMQITLEQGYPKDETSQTNNIKHLGANYYILNLGNNPISGHYRLVIFDAKKSKYELKFEVK